MLHPSLLALPGLLAARWANPSTFANAGPCGEIKPRPPASGRAKRPARQGERGRGSQQSGASEISPKAGVRQTDPLASHTACGERVRGCRELLVRCPKSCFVLAFEQRSPPEGPLAQSWGSQAPATLLGRLLPPGSHGPASGISRLGCPSLSPWVNTLVSLGQPPGPALLEKWPESAREGAGGERRQHPISPRVQGEEGGQPHARLSPLSTQPPRLR